MESQSTNDAARTLVHHFAPDVQEAYLRFNHARAPDDADTVILAVVRDHMPETDGTDPDLSNDQLSLIADLGFDSVAIAEMVFFIEDLFQVQISNEEILRLRSIGDLRTFVRAKLAESA